MHILQRQTCECKSPNKPRPTIKWLILNVSCLSPLSATAGSLSITPSPTTTTSHAVRTSARCTSPTSAGGGAVTTDSSRRNESSPTGHGRLTSTSTSPTGAPRLVRPTGRWREQSRQHLWYRRRHDLVLGCFRAPCHRD